MNNQMRPMAYEERKQADEFFKYQTKPPTGILWKLSPEEREALKRLCMWAETGPSKFPDGAERIRLLINQLLGEEK